MISLVGSFFGFFASCGSSTLGSLFFLLILFFYGFVSLPFFLSHDSVFYGSLKSSVNK